MDSSKLQSVVFRNKGLRCTSKLSENRIEKWRSSLVVWGRRYVKARRIRRGREGTLSLERTRAPSSRGICFETCKKKKATILGGKGWQSRLGPLESRFSLPKHTRVKLTNISKREEYLVTESENRNVIEHGGVEPQQLEQRVKGSEGA
jgi:hypothetical protein